MSDVVSSVSNGKELTVISQTLGTDLKIWYQVKVDSVTAGYVRSDLVIAARPKAYAEWTATAASNTGVVNIRSGPSTNTAVISGYSQMNNGDQCTVYGQVEGPDDGRVWYKVKVMNTWFGYVRADLLSHGTTVTLTHGYAKWNGKLQGATQNVNIRTDAGTGYDIAATLPNGTNVEVIGTKNGADNYVWYQVRTSGAAGYVRSDLVVHAGNTIGDNPYTVVSWQGRMVTNQAVNVYDYPMATEEASYPVPMGTYFLISEKVFDSNGGIWYHGTAEDGVVDQNNNAVSGFIRESEVKVFPKATECQNDNDTHEYQYPDRNVLEECSKCGKHENYRKPAKTLSEGESIVNLSSIMSVTQNIETAYKDYYFSNNGSNPSNYELLMTLLSMGRKNLYDNEEFQAIFGRHHVDSGFLSYLEDNNSTLYTQANNYYMNASVPRVKISDQYGYLDWKHFLCTLQGYTYKFISVDLGGGYLNGLPLVPKYWTGWGGDLATLASDVANAEVYYKERCAAALMGKEIDEIGIGYENVTSDFGWVDFISDTDAIGISSILNTTMNTYCEHFLSDALQKYYLTEKQVCNRKWYLLDDIYSGSIPSSITIEDLTDTLNDKQYAPHVLQEALVILFPPLLPFIYGVSVAMLKGGDASTDDHYSACFAFAKYILTESDGFDRQ